MLRSTTVRILFLCLLLHRTYPARLDVRGDGRKINIENSSGTKLEINWIHPQTDERVQSSILVHHGASFELNSFVTHTFEARELPGTSGACRHKDQTSCRIGFFTVNDNDSQAVTIDENFEVRHIDSKSIARESAQTLLEDCQNSVISAIEKDITLLAHNAVQMVSECIFQSVSLEMEKASEEIRFQASLRTKMAGHFENATCADFELPSSEPIATNIWRHKGVSRKVETLLERDASKVHVISNFISEEECNAMVEERAKSSLHSSAKVADGKGRREELSSPTRKAMHAGIKIPWHQEDDGNPLTTVSRKVYDYVNDVLDLNIEEHGQEDLMSIHYFGRGKNGKNDTVPADRYMPHCDGDCDGMTHRDGQRMASIIMYCTIPEKGGATIFRNSGLYIVPERLSATFVSYIDPDTFVMDNGFTEHSGCPVIEGEKHIVIQWVRYGVDDENPWDSSFNTQTVEQ